LYISACYGRGKKQATTLLQIPAGDSDSRNPEPYYKTSIHAEYFPRNILTYLELYPRFSSTFSLVFRFISFRTLLIDETQPRDKSLSFNLEQSLPSFLGIQEMVSIKAVKGCNAALIKSQPLVAVITGGTSGIGEHTIRTLDDIHDKEGKGLRIYLVSREGAAAKHIISDCLELCPKETFRFVQAGDLALLKDVDHVCADITTADEVANPLGEKPRIFFLVMGHAYLAFEVRQGKI
jgi:hypothetical protein